MDTETFLSIYAELIEQGQQVSLTVTGGSMTPFLGDKRDKVLLQKQDIPLKRGDIALFKRRSGYVILHRVCRIDRDGNYYFVGDAQQNIEGPIEPQQILGKAVKAWRKGKWIGPGDFWWDFFAGIWLFLLPVRPVLRGFYGCISRIWKRGKSNAW